MDDKKFIKPELDIILFLNDDIITESGDPWWWGGDVDIGGEDGPDIT